MANNEVESGLELVLDNRKLIIAFALLVALCGCFFVVGFIEGKRQGFQEGNQTATETAPRTAPEAAQPATENPPKDETRPAAQETANQPLDWYKNVNSKEEQPAALASTPATAEPVVAAKKQPPPEPVVHAEKHKAPASPEAGTYSVQVGAFNQKREMESRAKLLKEKGFDSRMESPSEPGQFFLLKVGKFKTRAEAAAMRLRLQREGIASFIKIN